MLFIFSVHPNQDFSPLLKFKKQLEKKNKTVDLLGFFNGKKKDFQREFDQTPFPILNRSDLNFFLSIKNPELKELLPGNYDLLINFDLQKQSQVHLFASLANAKFKVGLDTDRLEIYDLMVEKEGQLKNWSDVIHATKEVMDSVFSTDL